MSRKSDEALAKIMFNAYNEQGPNPWKTFDGRAVPKWEELSEQVKAKWCAAASMATKTVTKICVEAFNNVIAQQLEDEG